MAQELQRFVDAQAPVINLVLDELARGRKESHWMWFVFPQMAGLGQSPTSRYYAIASLDEARAYLAHPLLGDRLRQCTHALLQTTATTAEEVFGSIDALKLRSSMTLFHRADPEEPLFRQVLERWFDGEPDRETDRLLGLAS